MLTMNQQSIQPCCSSSQSSAVQIMADSDHVPSADIHKKSVEENALAKTKAEVRAERRAVQVSKEYFVFVV